MAEHIYNHTPGPWRISTPNGPNMGWQVGPVWIGRNAGTPQGLADAKLVSAAQRLLKACNTVRDNIRRVIDGTDYPAEFEFFDMETELHDAIKEATDE